MELLDFILNIAALLLWLGARPVSPVPSFRPQLQSLFVSVKTRSAYHYRHIFFLIGLLLLLQVRGFLYWAMGSQSGWVAQLEFGVVSIPFRSDIIWRMFAFSFLSFGYFLLLYFFSLLLLALINRRLVFSDPMQKWIHTQLGPFGRWHPVAQFFVPLMILFVAWIGLLPLFLKTGLMPPTGGAGKIIVQGVLVGMASYLHWKYILVAILFLHLMNSYVYLGSNPVWTYVDLTAKKILFPIRWLPLTVSKFDFVPFVGIILILLSAQAILKILSNYYQYWVL